MEGAVLSPTILATCAHANKTDNTRRHFIETEMAINAPSSGSSWPNGTPGGIYVVYMEQLFFLVYRVLSVSTTAHAKT
jgi:hypothetical protein